MEKNNQKKANLNQVAEIIWDILESHREGDDSTQIYYNQTKAKFTTSPYEFEDTPISDADAKRKIFNIISDRYEKDGKILIYTCQDNYEILFEEPKDDYIETSEKQSTVIPFYIAFD